MKNVEKKYILFINKLVTKGGVTCLSGWNPLQALRADRADQDACDQAAKIQDRHIPDDGGKANKTRGNDQLSHVMHDPPKRADRYDGK